MNGWSKWIGVLVGALTLAGGFVALARGLATADEVAAIEHKIDVHDKLDEHPVGAERHHGLERRLEAVEKKVDSTHNVVQRIDKRLQKMQAGKRR